MLKDRIASVGNMGASGEPPTPYPGPVKQFSYYSLALPLMRIFLLLLVAGLIGTDACAQERRFNAELDRYCKDRLAEVATISAERKTMLESIARQLAPKKYVLFTCKTNSRRTVMLQVWAQAAFYYYGLYDKLSFSIGDTVTNIYPETLVVLMESGFYCKGMNAENSNGYLVSVNEEYPANVLLSKNDLGTIDTAKGAVVNICYAPEQSELAATTGHINLPYQSPAKFDNTPQEKLQYAALNKQIATEMLYLAARTREYMLEK